MVPVIERAVRARRAPAAASATADGLPVATDGLPEELLPIIEILPLQRLAWRVAIDRGFDPDRPRGLSKVTQTLLVRSARGGRQTSPPMSTSRLEAFSDGVIAVAITLLALNLPLPPSTTNLPVLAPYLGRHWPSFAAFVVSFLTIGIIWMNHHAMVRRLRSADTEILFLNVLLLMTICLLPFTTALMAKYLRAPQGEQLAAAIWGGSFLLMGSVFLAVQWHLMVVKPHLLDERLTPKLRRAVLRRNAVGVIPYAVATAAAAITPYITLVICGLVAAFYALPGTTEFDLADDS